MYTVLILAPLVFSGVQSFYSSTAKLQYTSCVTYYSIFFFKDLNLLSPRSLCKLSPMPIEVAFCPVVSCPALSCPAVFCPVVSSPVVSCLAVSCPVVSFLLCLTPCPGLSTVPFHLCIPFFSFELCR